MARSGARAAAGLAALALVGGLLSACGGDDGGPKCDTLVSQIVEPKNPLLTPDQMDEQPDEHRDRIRGAVTGWQAPFGDVMGGVDYNYDQWIRLYGATGGVLAVTKRNAPITYLSSEDLEAAWALEAGTDKMAWDTTRDMFLMLTLPARKPIEVHAHDLATGKARWCTPLKSFFEEGDPLTTTSLDDGDVVVAAKSGSSAEVVRLGSEDGTTLWHTNLPSVDRADFVGSFGDQLVVGGREDHHLASGQHPAPQGPALTGIDAKTGAFRWRYSPLGTGHVLGVVGPHLLVLEQGPGTRLVALRPNGRAAWARKLPPTALQSTLRGGVVLLKSQKHLLGYDGRTGKRLWTRELPKDKTYTPYGFTLGQMPSLDEHHLLFPKTTELWMFDVRVGLPARRFPMPVDGINTTYWPYQLLVTERVLGVVSNTGAIVARRE